jgi:RimJ/RimL family protein N-acetyltransferase
LSAAARILGRTIETARLRLREWRDADLAPFAALNADPEVMRYFPTVQTRVQSDAGVARARALESTNGFSFRAAELRATGEFIGMIGLNAPAWSAHFTPCVEIGWRLARRYWGQGLAIEGARASLAFGFGELGLRQIVSCTVPENAPSRALMARLGFVHDVHGDFDHPRIPEYSPRRRHVLYRLDRTQYLRATP